MVATFGQVRLCERIPRLLPSPLRTVSRYLAMRLVESLAVGLNWAQGSRAGNALGILMFHRTTDPVSGVPAPSYNVAPDQLRKQLAGLSSRGFQFWPLSKVLRHHAEGTAIPPRTVLVTFDDGYATLYDKAYPILRECGVPATLFVCTAYLDSDGPFPFDAWGLANKGCAPAHSYRPLTTEECRELVASGLIEIGAHTHTHDDYRGRPRAFRDDLQKSVDLVRAKFGIEEVPFAFPYGGRHTGFAADDLVEAAQHAGVACGLTTEPILIEPDSDPFRWGRFEVLPWDTSTTLAAKLSGWYSWAPQLKHSCVRTVKSAFGVQQCRAPSIIT